MILEVGKYERNAFYFDCFLSGYPREQEYLFIGGYAAIRIKNIFQFTSMDDEVQLLNHHKHLQSIDCFFASLSDIGMEQENFTNNDISSKSVRQLLLRLNNNKNDMTIIPEYIIKLFASDK